MRKQLELNGGLVLAALATGALLVPLAGWWSLIVAAAGCGTSFYIAEQFNKRR